MSLQSEYLQVVAASDLSENANQADYYDLVAHDSITKLGRINGAIALHFQSKSGFLVDNSLKSVKLDPSLQTLDERNRVFADVACDLKQLPQFRETLLKGWRNELYVVYNPTHTPYIHIERAFSVLLGVVTYGVHINGYILARNTSDGKLKMWVPRRAATKPTFPGKLDNTVAGGLGLPHGIWETVIKECGEEAGLEESFVINRAKAVGACLYNYLSEDGNIQPELQYVFDLEFADETSVIPNPVDGEVEKFTLMDFDEIKMRLCNGEFKPNCGLVIVDFMIRHGLLTSNTERDYLEIVARSHRWFGFPLM